MQKVEEMKYKILGILKKQQVQIPRMGFDDHSLHNVPLVPENYMTKPKEELKEDSGASKLSDQEILESTEAIYFAENVDTAMYELKKLAEGDEPFKVESIEESMLVLKSQHKVISKKVLQMILDKRSSCNEEFQRIGETEQLLQESLWVTKKSRSFLKEAKKHLTTTSLEILAAYKKRQQIQELLLTLRTLKNMKEIDQQLQELLNSGNYSGAISILLQNKNQSEKYSQFKCTESLTQKLQDTLDASEVQLDNVLSNIPQNFDKTKYSELLEAYKLLGKTHLAMDQLHMSFISSIHSTSFNVLKEHLDQSASENQKLFEQMCENLEYHNYINCLTSLCKSFWKILVCYHQVKMWHQNYKLYNTTTKADDHEELLNDEYIQEKLKKGQHRIWNDIQSKICIYLTSTKLCQLKYEHFIQILSIVQRLKKVGQEFCDDNSTKMMECMRTASIEFFKRYHITCLDEINLFLEHEVWIQVSSFTSVIQLQEFRSVKRALKRHTFGNGEMKAIIPINTPIKKNQNDNDSSINSQDESSIYGSCGYFIRFSEKSSPFDFKFDQRMLEEDILSGIADETSCYYSDSSDNDFECNNNKEMSSGNEISSSSLTINNTVLNVLRCIGRYLQMCRLLHSIAPHIIYSMTELVDFYIYSVYDLFAKDLPQHVPADALHTAELDANLKRIAKNVIIKMKKWPPSSEMIAYDLKDPDQMYGLTKRINAVESCISVLQQFTLLHGYLDYLIMSTKSDPTVEANERESLQLYVENTQKYIYDLRKPIFTCVTARVVEVQGILTAINKIKWDINHVTVEHSAYVDIINRATQLFAGRLEEMAAVVTIPKEALWDSLAHFVTHLLIEGYSQAKKCSAAGRALMQLDTAHFISILELLSGMKHPVHQQYVDQYLKAFYMGSALEEFIVSQKNYSGKHMIGLIHCSCSNDKKLRQKLLALVENSDSRN